MLYLHVSEKILRVEGLEGSLSETLTQGQAFITPKKVDRRDPPT